MKSVREILDDETDILTALGNWFESQDVGTRASALICTHMAGIVAGVTVEDQKEFDLVVDRLSNIFKKTARASFDQKQQEMEKKRGRRSSPH